MDVLTKSRVTFPSGKRDKRGAVRFKFLTGDCNYKEHGGTFISKRFHNGDWHYWLALRVSPDEEGLQDGYYVSLEVVSPEAAEGELYGAAQCCGAEEYLRDERDLLEVLLSCGTSHTVAIFKSKNFKHAWQMAHDEARSLSILFGFAMDRQVNAFGASGWDAVAGNLYGHMRSPQEKEKPALEELAKTDKLAELLYKLLKPLKDKSQKIRDAGGY